MRGGKVSNSKRHIVKYYNYNAKQKMYKTVYFVDEFFGWGDDEEHFFTEKAARIKIKERFKQNHEPKVFER